LYISILEAKINDFPPIVSIGKFDRAGRSIFRGVLGGFLVIFKI